MPKEISDSELTGELAGLIDRLRMPSYGRVASGIDKALEGSIDEFVDLLARHLLYEEDVLFPALREAAPDQAEDLAGLSCEHKDLRQKALGLAQKVKAGDRPGACAMGREFLAALFSHVQREDEVTGRITAGLSGSSASRLRARLEREETAPGHEDLCA